MLKQCEDFADRRLALSEQLYRLRGEDSVNKMRADIVNGALAEFAVYEYLLQAGYDVLPPDLNIYETRQKSFAADLVCQKASFHVKSQTRASAEKYGLSWLFQDSDRLLELPSEKGYLVLCMVDGNIVEIRAIISAIELVESGCISRPKIGKYALTKKAIYYADLLASKLNIWRLP